MSYTKQTWADGSAGGTPLSATRLNHIEDGLANVYDKTESDARYANETDLAPVATAGTYTSLTAKPTLGTAAALNVGVASGVAGLGSDGKLPVAQLGGSRLIVLAAADPVPAGTVAGTVILRTA